MAAAAGNADDIDDFAEAPDDAAVVADQPRRRRASGQRVAAVAVASLLLCALLAASGFMLWQGHQASERQAQEAEFAAAARQGVVNLMSLDFNNGDADIKRLIDSTTGQFRDDFEKSKNDFLTVMKDSKVVTKAEVKATGRRKHDEGLRRRSGGRIVTDFQFGQRPAASARRGASTSVSNGTTAN